MVRQRRMQTDEKRERTLGVIGGSGLYDLDGLTEQKWVKVETPFGAPSDEFLTGKLFGHRLIFLPRHGRGHRILPNEINFRANVCGMKQLGAEWIVSVSAVGSLREEIHPGDLVVVDQFIDRTRARPQTFFGDGIAAHVSFADPISSELAMLLVDAAEENAARVHKKGTYIVIDGPAFSTRAESHMYRQFGADIIGMTNLPEAKLAREAEIGYATLALVTDYDCWKDTEIAVHVEAVVATLKKNVALAKAVVRDTIRRLPEDLPSSARNALAGAIMTAPNQITADAKKRLTTIAGKYFV